MQLLSSKSTIILIFITNNNATPFWGSSFYRALLHDIILCLFYYYFLQFSSNIFKNSHIPCYSMSFLFWGLMVISIYLSAEDKNIFLSFLQPGLDFSAYFIFHCVFCVVPGIIFCSIMFSFSKVQSGLLVGAFFSVLKKTTLVSHTDTELKNLVLQSILFFFVICCMLYTTCVIYIFHQIFFIPPLLGSKIGSTIYQAKISIYQATVIQLFKHLFGFVSLQCIC